MLDDWSVFLTQLSVLVIIWQIQQLRSTINPSESVLQLTSALLCLGFSIIVSDMITLADTCIWYLFGCATIKQHASHLPIQQIVGYITWLTWAMNWPQFRATNIYSFDTVWIFWFHRHYLLCTRSHTPVKHQQLCSSEHVAATPATGSFGVEPAPIHFTEMSQEKELLVTWI
jgi:hypothetical protein